MDNSDFFGPNLAKNRFLVWNSENKFWNKNQLPWLFWRKIAQQGTFGLQIQKTNVGIRISILEILCVLILRQNRRYWLFGSKFAQKWILGSEFQRTNVAITITILQIPCVPIFRQNRQLCLFWPNFAQKWTELGTEFQKSRSRFGWSELGGGGWSWVKQGGGGWSCVEVSAQFSNTQKKTSFDDGNRWSCWQGHKITQNTK